MILPNPTRIAINKNLDPNLLLWIHKLVARAKATDEWAEGNDEFSLGKVMVKGIVPSKVKGRDIGNKFFIIKEIAQANKIANIACRACSLFTRPSINHI